FATCTAARCRRGNRRGEVRPRDAAPLCLNHETPRKLLEAGCVAYEHRTRPAQTRLSGIMRSTIAACAILVLLIGTADAEQCPPGALGVSRTLVVDPNEHSRVGSMQYPETLPLNDHEVVLTFDDGPLPRYTNRVLETLTTRTSSLNSATWALRRFQAHPRSWKTSSRSSSASGARWSRMPAFSRSKPAPSSA